MTRQSPASPLLASGVASRVGSIGREANQLCSPVPSPVLPESFKVLTTSFFSSLTRADEINKGDGSICRLFPLLVRIKLSTLLAGTLITAVLVPVLDFSTLTLATEAESLVPTLYVLIDRALKIVFFGLGVAAGNSATTLSLLIAPKDFKAAAVDLATMLSLMVTPKFFVKTEKMTRLGIE